MAEEELTGGNTSGAGADQVAGHVQLYRDDAAWLADHLADLSKSRYRTDTDGVG